MKYTPIPTVIMKSKEITYKEKGIYIEFASTCTKYDGALTKPHHFEEVLKKANEIRGNNLSMEDLFEVLQKFCDLDYLDSEVYGETLLHKLDTVTNNPYRKG